MGNQQKNYLNLYYFLIFEAWGWLDDRNTDNIFIMSLKDFQFLGKLGNFDSKKVREHTPVSTKPSD